MPTREEIAQAALTALAGDYCDEYTIADAILALPSPAPVGEAAVPREPTDAMLKSAFAAMNATPSGEWKRMKAEGRTPRELFDAKMRPRWTAMWDAVQQTAAAETREDGR